MTRKQERVVVVCACFVISVLVGFAMPWMVEKLEDLWDTLQYLWLLFLTM